MCDKNNKRFLVLKAKSEAGTISSLEKYELWLLNKGVIGGKT